MDKNIVRILSIETSCDETSVAILEYNKKLDNAEIVKHYISSQIETHARYGGVVPEVAARLHIAEIVSLLERVLGLKPQLDFVNFNKRQEIKQKISSLFDYIAVTRGPGLATALRVGVETARTLSFVYNKPLMAINHLEGHLASSWLMSINRKNWKFPVLFLLVSGGHTELILMKDFSDYEVLGRTRDDAAGEAFDKTAKLLGLEYPGGPKLSNLALKGDSNRINFPRPMINDSSLDMSFSGLKTAVRQYVEKKPVTNENLNDYSASIQQAIVDVLVAKSLKAIKQTKPNSFGVVGGVSANFLLRETLRKEIAVLNQNINFFIPAEGLYTDNAAMIAGAGVWYLKSKKEFVTWQDIKADPSLDF